jgi:hypothetical protein
MEFESGMGFLKARAADIEGQGGLQARNDEERRRDDEAEKKE